MRDDSTCRPPEWGSMYPKGLRESKESLFIPWCAAAVASLIYNKDLRYVHIRCHLGCTLIFPADGHFGSFLAGKIADGTVVVETGDGRIVIVPERLHDSIFNVDRHGLHRQIHSDQLTFNFVDILVLDLAG